MLRKKDVDFYLLPFHYSLFTKIELYKYYTDLAFWILHELGMMKP